MTIPKFIKILGFDWEVIQSADVANEGACYGSTHHSKQKFFFDPTNSPQHLNEVVLHEILHALWWQMGLSARFKKEGMSHEEEIISTLASGLNAVFKDNAMLK